MNTVVKLFFTLMCLVLRTVSLDAQFLPITIRNATNNANVHTIFIVVKGINPNTNKQCFISFSKQSPQGVYEDITLGIDATQFSYPSTIFKDNTFKIPDLISGRIYVALNKKLIMPIVTAADGTLGIADPSPYNTTDPNFNTFFDKIECTYVNGTSWINPTAVDFFALPLTIAQHGSTYGLSVAREKIIDACTTAFAHTYNKAWQKLVVRDAHAQVLRVLAPGRDDTYFDKNYLTGTPYNYVDDVWTYYQTRTLNIDCSELQGDAQAPQLGSYIFEGRVQNDVFVFTNQTQDYTVSIEKPSSDSFFLAAQGAFDAQNNTPRAVIVRNLATAWCVGLLPTADGALLNRAYYDEHQAGFYTNNPLLASQSKLYGPFYNLYGKVIHQFSKTIYTWPYYDAFGFDGTNAAQNSQPVVLTVWGLFSVE